MYFCFCSSVACFVLPELWKPCPPCHPASRRASPPSPLGGSSQIAVLGAIPVKFESPEVSLPSPRTFITWRFQQHKKREYQTRSEKMISTILEQRVSIGQYGTAKCRDIVCLKGKCSNDNIPAPQSELSQPMGQMLSHGSWRNSIALFCTHMCTRTKSPPNPAGRRLPDQASF